MIYLAQQMEKFKHVERDVKIKKYSKEGLLKDEKIDPKEIERRERIEWGASKIAELKLQIEKQEAELEQLQSMAKRGRREPQRLERWSTVETNLEQERWHVERLELVNRLLENSVVDTEKVKQLDASAKMWYALD